MRFICTSIERNFFFQCHARGATPEKYVACACEARTHRFGIIVFGDSNLAIKPVVRDRMYYCLLSWLSCFFLRHQMQTLDYFAFNVRCRCCRLCCQIRNDKVNLYSLARWGWFFPMFVVVSPNYTYGNRGALCVCLCLHLLLQKTYFTFYGHPYIRVFAHV